MDRIDYRGPLLWQEAVMVLALAAEITILVLVGRRHLGADYSGIVGSALAVVWVVALRRFTPSHRHSTDRLLIAYRTNLALAEQAGPGELDRVRLGLP